jgi:hypothetical protein
LEPYDAEHMLDELHRAFTEAGLLSRERLRFFELCRPCSNAELRGEVARVEEHLGRVRAAARADPTIDAAGAARIAGALKELLTEDWEYEERRLLAGAVAYFVLRDDASDDLDHLSGIDDDARVVRTVSRALGRADLARRI